MQYELVNRSNQMNPNNNAYWESRGYNERPDNWKKLVKKSRGSRRKNESLVSIQ